MARLTAKLGQLRPELGFTAIRPLIEITAPGRGFHAGGSFPMSRRPRSGETDLLGRPFGYARVHLVDASTFPTIPATTITLAVMANAHRIGAAPGHALRQAGSTCCLLSHACAAVLASCSVARQAEVALGPESGG